MFRNCDDILTIIQSSLSTNILFRKGLPCQIFNLCTGSIVYIENETTRPLLEIIFFPCTEMSLDDVLQYIINTNTVLSENELHKFCNMLNILIIYDQNKNILLLVSALSSQRHTNNLLWSQFCLNQVRILKNVTVSLY